MGIDMDSIVTVPMGCTAVCSKKASNGKCKIFKEKGVMVMTLMEDGCCKEFEKATEQVAPSGRAKY